MPALLPGERQHRRIRKLRSHEALAVRSCAAGDHRLEAMRRLKFKDAELLVSDLRVHGAASLFSIKFLIRVPFATLEKKVSPPSIVSRKNKTMEIGFVLLNNFCGGEPGAVSFVTPTIHRHPSALSRAAISLTPARTANGISASACA